MGPGLVYLQFNHSFLGRGVMMHCVTPVEPLLQCVTHTMFYQANIPQVIPNFILKVESIQVRHLLATVRQPLRILLPLRKVLWLSENLTGFCFHPSHSSDWEFLRCESVNAASFRSFCRVICTRGNTTTQETCD